MIEKKFKLNPDQIKPIAPGRGACFASNKITIEGRKVGYMYREIPGDRGFSGWVFLAGDESREYLDDPENIAIYDVNTICNYDTDIIPFLDAGYNKAFVRDSETGKFIAEEFSPPVDS
jgi:hypothetical protein